MNCPCGGNVKETSWLVNTPAGLEKHHAEHLTAPVIVKQLRCEACGNCETTYKELDE